MFKKLYSGQFRSKLPRVKKKKVFFFFNTENIFMRCDFCMPVIWVHRHMLTTKTHTALEFPEDQLITGQGLSLRGPW